MTAYILWRLIESLPVRVPVLRLSGRDGRRQVNGLLVVSGLIHQLDEAFPVKQRTGVSDSQPFATNCFIGTNDAALVLTCHVLDGQCVPSGPLANDCCRRSIFKIGEGYVGPRLGDVYAQVREIEVACVPCGQVVVQDLARVRWADDYL